MPALSDILNYVTQTLVLWAMRLFAQDSANPNYKYAWMPPICGKQFGLVICDRPNQVMSTNIGPTMEEWREQANKEAERAQYDEEKEAMGPPGGVIAEARPRRRNRAAAE
jgi:hypothetical protein